jgi:phosphoribosylamine--glycine ligase
MNVLLIGSGGREHALAWAILASPLLGKLYCAPGNAGIAEIAECVALDAADHAAVVRFCQERRIDLVVVGPEAPLVAGLADDLAAAKIKVFGPSRAAAPWTRSSGRP